MKKWFYFNYGSNLKKLFLTYLQGCEPRRSCYSTLIIFFFLTRYLNRWKYASGQLLVFPNNSIIKLKIWMLFIMWAMFLVFQIFVDMALIYTIKSLIALKMHGFDRLSFIPFHDVFYSTTQFATISSPNSDGRKIFIFLISLRILIQLISFIQNVISDINDLMIISDTLDIQRTAILFFHILIKRDNLFFLIVASLFIGLVSFRNLFFLSLIVITAF